MWITTIVFLFIFQISYTYKTDPTSWLCAESTNDAFHAFPSCLPGYVIDVEKVVYESTHDNKCSGITLCHLENNSTLLFTCNRKRTCLFNMNHLNFYINSTCGSAIRLFIKYRCLPVIQEQNDYLCTQSTKRHTRLGDINLSCERNYRLHITEALIGMSIKTENQATNHRRFACNKNTTIICNYTVPNAYHDICNNQLNEKHDNQCKIKYYQRPPLKACPYGMMSNYSLVKYLCIPGDGIKDDLPRIDICSTDISERLSFDRGLLHSPNYPQALGQYLSCKKQLYIPLKARLRLFMLEKSIEYSHEFNIYLFNRMHTLARNELFDKNLTDKNKDEIVEFELKTNHVGAGYFLLYFQVDTYIPEYAPLILRLDENIANNGDQGKALFKRNWGIIIGFVVGLVALFLIIVLIFIIIRVSKHHRTHVPRYLKSDDDRHHGKDSQNEKPYLTSSSPIMLSSSVHYNQKRPNSASSTTSSIVIHQLNDGQSDRESLIKPINQIQSRSNTDIDNFYEEIKEQQQQATLAIGKNDSKGDLINPYLEAKFTEEEQIFFQGNNNSTKPIRDHHEKQRPYPSTSAKPSNKTNQQIKRSKNLPPKIPSEWMNMNGPKPSAPPFPNNDE